MSGRPACPACLCVPTAGEVAAAARRRRIAFLMRAGRATSQKAIAAAVGVTQSQVSRDLVALGAVRRASADWAMPQPQPRTRRRG